MLSRGLHLRTCRAQAPVADVLRFYATPGTGKKPDEAKVCTCNSVLQSVVARSPWLEAHAWGQFQLKSALTQRAHAPKESGAEYANHQAEQSTDFFTAGVKATVGTVWEVPASAAWPCPQWRLALRK